MRSSRTKTALLLSVVSQLMMSRFENVCDVLVLLYWFYFGHVLKCCILASKPLASEAALKQDLQEATAPAATPKPQAQEQEKDGVEGREEKGVGFVASH